jgi:hypothetical protein
MKTLVMCRPRAGVERQQIAAYAGEEMAELRRLREEGVLLEAYSPQAGWQRESCAVTASWVVPGKLVLRCDQIEPDPRSTTARFRDSVL